MAYYTMVVNDKNTTYASYASSHSHTNSEFDALNSTYQGYMGTHSHTNSEYDGYVSTHSYTNSEYASQYSALQSQVQILTNENDQLQIWLDGNTTLLQTTMTERDQLQTWLNGNITNYESIIGSLNTQISSLQSQIASLNSQISSLRAASLTTVGLDVTNFNHYWAWDPPSHLTINGCIFNMGTNTAYSCKLHVKVWSSTNALLLDTTVDLGSISGRNYVSKSTETPYTGSGSYWSVIPEWTTTP